MFEEIMRDGFEFDPIHLQVHPDEHGKYRILDGAHRFKAYKGIGEKAVAAEIINLNGKDPLTYAAKMAIGPRLLNDDEARNTARRAYQNNPKLSSEEIAKDVARSRQTVDRYIADLRAATQIKLDLILFRMKKLGIPHEKISERLGILLKTIYNRISAKMPMWAKWPISDLEQGFTVSQVAEKHGWSESLVWSVALDDENDLGRFSELQWGIRTWDYWSWNDCDKRFGDEWPDKNRLKLFRLKTEGKDENLTAFRLIRFSLLFNTDWRDFQGTPALEENEESAILIIDYCILMRKAGWAVSHVIQAPMSSERFQGGTVSAMRNKKILGVTCRNVLVERKK